MACSRVSSIPAKPRHSTCNTVQFTLNQPFAVFTAILAELWVVNSKMCAQTRKRATSALVG